VFDIGFLELVIIATVALLVIGPERLPGAVRTCSVYLRRIRRSFNELRQEVEQELHNDAVMQDLKKTRDDVAQQASQWRDEVTGSLESPSQEGQTGDPARPGTAPEQPGKVRE
jgi:sec-independent protein translocase protein TatB